jgi:hypothetical protein
LYSINCYILYLLAVGKVHALHGQRKSILAENAGEFLTVFCEKVKLLLSPVLKSYSHTKYKPESQGFCFQMFTVAHFLDFLLLPWFFVPTVEMRGDFVYFLFVSLIWLNEFFASTFIRRKKIMFSFSSFQMSSNPRKPSNCLD